MMKKTNQFPNYENRKQFITGLTFVLNNIIYMPLRSALQHIPIGDAPNLLASGTTPRKGETSLKMLINNEIIENALRVVSPIMYMCIVSCIFGYCRHRSLFCSFFAALASVSQACIEVFVVDVFVYK